MELSVENMTIGYRGGEPLCPAIDLRAESGEAIALVGSNGVGKSTLLRSIAGVVAPRSGDVLLDGQSLLAMKAHERARSVAFVSTEMITTAYLTVNQIVSLGRAPYSDWALNLSSADKAAIGRAMELTDVVQLGERFIDTLSDGQRQRVMVARALAQDTPLIVLDEPTAFLDPENREMIIRLLCDLARDMNKIVLFSTHEVDLATKYGHCLWRMTTRGISF